MVQSFIITGDVTGITFTIHTSWLYLHFSLISPANSNLTVENLHTQSMHTKQVQARSFGLILKSLAQLQYPDHDHNMPEKL